MGHSMRHNEGNSTSRLAALTKRHEQIKKNFEKVAREHEVITRELARMGFPSFNSDRNKKWG